MCVCVGGLVASGVHELSDDDEPPAFTWQKSDEESAMAVLSHGRAPPHFSDVRVPSGEAQRPTRLRVRTSSLVSPRL